MGMFHRLVYMNVRVRFLTGDTICVPMLMVFIVDVPVFVHHGRVTVPVCMILGEM